ncbi:MAG: radical SAM protein, partial [Chloroflexi bacterium]|nr:radical SAM protein [Chloroflexota bacterium]
EEGIEPIVRFAPDLIGVTAMTNNYHSAREMIGLLKGRLSCPIVMGGPHATLFPERMITGDGIASAAIDYVVVGEGEDTLRDLVRALGAYGFHPPEAVLSDIRGLVWARNGQVVRNPERPLRQDLDALPFPARHLFALERYGLCAPGGEPMVTVLSSRGCPYHCSYCFKGIVGRTYRQRSPENVLRELKLLTDDYGYRHVYFIDDLFTYDPERLAAICQGMIAAELDLRWQCLARVDRVRPELLRLMYRAGCREVHYGIESGNPQILRHLGKGITLEQVRQAVAWTVEAGILVKGYFMLGLPGDTLETMQQTIELAAELELDQAMFSLTTPFPGTRLWDELVAREPGIEFDHDFSRAFYYANYEQTVEPFFNLSHVSDGELTRLAAEAQARFQEAKRRRKYVRALGSQLGGLCYRLSTIRPLRRMGHALLNLPPVRDLRRRGSLHRLASLGHYDLQEEFSQKWN